MNINAIEELQKSMDSYDIQVGVFTNVPRKKPISGPKAKIGILAGGAIRRSRTDPTPSMSADVAAKLNQKFHWLDRPFKSSNNKSLEILSFTKYFVTAIGQGKKDASTLKRIGNLMQAIVRNPILRGDYGRNSSEYAKLKGFNRLLFDTGQFFKSITAKVK